MAQPTSDAFNHGGLHDQEILNLYVNIACHQNSQTLLKKCFRLRNSVSIQVVVLGFGKITKWSLPKNLLTHYSPFFIEALKKSDKVPVIVPCDDPEVFEMFVKWLYIGGDKIYLSAATTHTKIMAWILGKTLECPAFQDHAMVHLLHYFHFAAAPLPMGPADLELTYKETLEQSKLRHWAIDQLLYHSYNGHLVLSAKECESVLQGKYNIERDIVRRLLGLGSDGARSPYLQGDRYLFTDFKSKAGGHPLNNYHAVEHTESLPKVSTARQSIFPPPPPFVLTSNTTDPSRKPLFPEWNTQPKPPTESPEKPGPLFTFPPARVKGSDISAETHGPKTAEGIFENFNPSGEVRAPQSHKPNAKGSIFGSIFARASEEQGNGEEDGKPSH